MNYSHFQAQKNEIVVVKQVHQEIRCFMSWLTMTERGMDNMQEIVDEASITFQYRTDGFSTDDALNYHQGRHLVALGKSQTYSIEGGNADLRHYLAILAKHSRCFSRSLQAFKNTIKLFVYC